jgi:hypothetical protein
MTGDARMLNSINTNDSNGYDSITFGDNGKDKIKWLSKIAISNDLRISNLIEIFIGYSPPLAIRTFQGIRVLHLTSVRIFIIFLFRGLGGILVEEESYILYVRSRMTDDSYSTMSRSNGYYRGRTAKKTWSFIV